MRQPARTRFASRIILLLVMSPVLLTRCQDAATRPKNTSSSEGNSDKYAYLAGRYELIGRIPDTTETFRGTVTVVVDDNTLRINRTIGRETISGRAWIQASGADGADVLRARFSISGQEYEATYLWRSDLDNYPLLTGRVYRAGTQSPGVEAWFPLPD